MMKTFDQFASMNKDVADSFMKSGTILAKGFEDINRQIMALVQASVEANIETGKAAMGVRTLKDFSDLQSGWIRNYFDTTLSEATKLSALSIKIANQAAEPIQSHFNDAFSKMGDGFKKAA